MCVPSFFFSYEQSSVLERCFEGQSPAATLGMPDFYFSFFPFHRIQHATIVSETFPCQLNSLLDTHQRVAEKKKKSSHIGCLWQNYFRQHTGRREMDTHHFQTVICAGSSSPEARQRRRPGCLSCRCRVPGSRQEGDSQVFPKVPRSSGTCAQASLAALKPVLSAVLNWTKLQPMWKTGAASHVGDTQLPYWPPRPSLGILPSPPLVNS